MGDDSASSSAPKKQASTIGIHEGPYDIISILASDDELESDATFEPIEPSTFLQHLGEDLEIDDKTSSDVTRELAAIVNKLWENTCCLKNLRLFQKSTTTQPNVRKCIPKLR